MLAPGRESRAALDLGQRLGVRPNDPTLPIELLSGGNQQKVVVGVGCTSVRGSMCSRSDRWRRCRRQAEIYRLFDVALQAGAAIVVVSTDFEEVAKAVPPRVGVRPRPRRR